MCLASDNDHHIFAETNNPVLTMPCKTLPKLQPTNQKSEYLYTLLELFEDDDDELMLNVLRCHLTY